MSIFFFFFQFFLFGFFLNFFRKPNIVMGKPWDGKYMSWGYIKYLEMWEMRNTSVIGQYIIILVLISTVVHFEMVKIVEPLFLLLQNAWYHKFRGQHNNVFYLLTRWSSLWNFGKGYFLSRNICRGVFFYKIFALLDIELIYEHMM